MSASFFAKCASLSIACSRGSGRPIPFRIFVWNDCTPKLNRFTPPEIAASIFSSVMSERLDSIVISTFSINGKTVRIRPKILSISSADRIPGVPPPKKTERICERVRYGRPASASISRQRSFAYSCCSLSSAFFLKNAQYVQESRQNGTWMYTADSLVGTPVSQISFMSDGSFSGDTTAVSLAAKGSSCHSISQAVRRVPPPATYTGSRYIDSIFFS